VTQQTSPLADATAAAVARRQWLWGTILGCISAVGYTAANGFLKAAAESELDPIWVSTVKTMPTVAGAFSLLVWLWIRGRRLFPARNVVLELLVAGLFGQIAGNVLFQWSLGIVGLAITVPLCFGAIICSSVVLGRLWLNESVTRATMVSVGLIVAAIWILSLSASEANQPIIQQTATTGSIATAVAAACIAGFAYGVLGMVIRRASIAKASVAATTFLISGVGTISLSMLSWQQHGWQVIEQTTADQWELMVWAGVCNFIAFVALTRALQITSLIFVNAINASQVAMAAVVGVLLFREEVSLGLILGSTLTVVGLLLMPRKSTISTPDHRPSEFNTELGVQKSANFDSSDLSRSSSHEDNSSNEPSNGAVSQTKEELRLADDVASGTE
jgi:drug/metabolite transporter (DMT)-like permease